MYRRSVSCLAALLVAVVLSATGPAKAAVVTFSYEGSITKMDGIMDSGPFSTGDPLSFSFSYETTTPDSDPGTTFGSYLDAVTSYTVTAGPYTAEGIFNTGDIEITDQSRFDLFSLTDGFPVGSAIAGRLPTFLKFTGLDTTVTGIYSSDALPAAPPSPAQFTFLRFDLTFTDQSGATGNITSQNLVPVSVVPLPAALPLFLSALAGLGFFGWRKRATA